MIRARKKQRYLKKSFGLYPGFVRSEEPWHYYWQIISITNSILRRKIMILRVYLMKLAAVALKKKKALDSIRASLEVKSSGTITGKIISITNGILHS